MNARQARNIRGGIAAARLTNVWLQMLWVSSRRDNALAIKAFRRERVRVAEHDRARFLGEA